MLSVVLLLVGFIVALPVVFVFGAQTMKKTLIEEHERIKRDMFDTYRVMLEQAEYDGVFRSKKKYQEGWDDGVKSETLKPQGYVYPKEGDR